MKRWLFSLGFLSVLVTVLGGLPASAHGDSTVANGEVNLAPGESISFDGELHYHRLVGRIDADGPLVVKLTDDRSGATAYQTGPSTSLRFNRLIQCCADATWAPHTLTVANPGSGSVRGSLDISLVHDDLAVMAFQAESGIVTSVVVMALVWSVAMWRIARRPGRTVPLARSVGWAVAAAGIVVIPASFGGLRYGTLGPPALVAALADLPLIPNNPFVSRASLLMGMTMILWALAASRWARSRTVAPRLGWTLLGLGLLGSIAATVAAMAASYDPVGIPVAMGMAAAVPVLAVLAVGLLGPAPNSLGVKFAPERKEK